MKKYYVDKIVDITDPYCIFIDEFDREISEYGAVVYNYEYNSYQFIKEFSDIDYKKDLLPDFMRVEKSNPLLNSMDLYIHYEFDPETEEDPENLEIWKELSQIEIPVFDYDEDGEIFVDKYVKHYPSLSKHSVWFLKPECLDYLETVDLLMISPIIKNIKISQKLIRDYGKNPIEE